MVRTNFPLTGLKAHLTEDIHIWMGELRHKPVAREAIDSRKETTAIGWLNDVLA